MKMNQTGGKENEKEKPSHQRREVREVSGIMITAGYFTAFLAAKAAAERWYFRDREAARRTARDLAVECVSLLTAAAVTLFLDHLVAQ